MARSVSIARIGFVFGRVSVWCLPFRCFLMKRNDVLSSGIWRLVSCERCHILSGELFYSLNLEGRSSLNCCYTGLFFIAANKLCNHFVPLSSCPTMIYTREKRILRLVWCWIIKSGCCRTLSCWLQSQGIINILQCCFIPEIFLRSADGAFFLWIFLRSVSWYSDKCKCWSLEKVVIFYFSIDN